MKIVTYIAAVVLLLGAACSQPKTVVSHLGQTISITDSTLSADTADTLRFGHMHSGEIAVKRITLRNDTAEPIVIIRHETTCHCASFEYDRRPIVPGGETNIECTFDSRGTRGWQMKLANFYISGAAHPIRIFLEADIE